MEALVSGIFIVQGCIYLLLAITPTVGAVIAGSGAALWGPWAFSSTSMTPMSAMTIGFGSVLAALIAGWAGVLAAQNEVRWYERWENEQTIADGRLSGAISETVYSAVSLETERRPKSALPATVTSGWMGIALLAFAGSLGGYSPLRWVCKTTDVVGAAFTCLPSPRLYTSVAAGFKATLPIVLAIVLAFVILKKVLRRYRQ